MVTIAAKLLQRRLSVIGDGDDNNSSNTNSSGRSSSGKAGLQNYFDSRAPLFVVFKFYSALLTGAQRKEQRQLHAALTKKINTNCAATITTVAAATAQCKSATTITTTARIQTRKYACVCLCVCLVTTEAAAALRFVFQHYPHLPTVPPSPNTACLFTYTHTVASEQVANKTTWDFCLPHRTQNAYKDADERRERESSLALYESSGYSATELPLFSAHVCMSVCVCAYYDAPRHWWT